VVKTRRAFLSSGLIGAVVLAAPCAAQAGAWPLRPVKRIVALGPDAFAEKLPARWTQPVIIMNCPDSTVATTMF
jgi:hypothetical protein